MRLRMLLPVVLAAPVLAQAPKLPPEVTITRPDATTLELRWNAESGQPGRVSLKGDQARTVSATNNGSDYRARLTGLKPDTVYRFTLSPYGDQAESREHVYATLPPNGTVETATVPVLTLVYTPIHYADAGPQNPVPESLPKHLTAEDLKQVTGYLEDVRQFYFHTTHGKVNLVWDIVPVTRDHRAAMVKQQADTGDDNPSDAFARDVQEVSAAKGKEYDRDYAGALLLYGWESAIDPAKREDPRKQSFGGLTYGTDAPWKFKANPYSWIEFTRNADIRWTVAHEFGHQLDAMMDYSGYPSLGFNHPDPGEPAGVYGGHWDANTYLLSHFPRDKWIGVTQGDRRVSKDTDGDGLADDDPFLPMDEKRFGSDPRRPDTDADGLGDLDEYTVTSGIYNGQGEEMGAKRTPPDPRNPDSDGDGLKDGEDPYPHYAVATIRRHFTPVLDGRIDDGEWQPAGAARARGTDGRFGLQWDDKYLYLSLQADRPLQLVAEIDAANDGWFAGADNYRLTVSPPEQAGGRPVIDGDIWDWSVFGQPNKYVDDNKALLAAQDIRAVSGTNGGYAVEVAIPYRYQTQLRLYDGKRIGVRLGIREPGDKWLYTTTEPYVMITMELDRTY